MSVKQSIFRAYDIRGIVDSELNQQTVITIGKAIGSYSILAGERNIVIGRDGRLTSASLRDYLVDGLKLSGCHIMDIGQVATPLLYFATKTTAASSGVMITGSHNPPQYNGFKIVIAGKTLSGTEIADLYKIIINKDYQTGAGSISEIDIKNNYLNEILADVKLQKPLKVAIDCGNGVTGTIAPILYQKLGCEIIPLFCNVDGNFNNHHPNPSDVKNLIDLQNAVTLNKADVGLAFDGDGDRLGVVDNLGDIIWADKQLILYAQDVLSRNKNASIIYDVKCSSLVPKMIKCYGGKAIIERTGHSFIKAKMQAEAALLAGEMSGHIFFKERWYGFDDALYSGARLLEILSKNKKRCADIFASLPKSTTTPEINIDFTKQGEQFAAMDKLNSCLDGQNFQGQITTIDGVRIDFSKPNGWGLVRPSNTTPSLVLRFEADNNKNLADILQKFKVWFNQAGVNSSVF